MEIIEANRKTCIKDGICAATCPGGLISFKPDDYPQPGPNLEKACTICGHCVAVCPTGSLNHREMPSDKCTPILKSLDITIEQIEQFLKSRSLGVEMERMCRQGRLTPDLWMEKAVGHVVSSAPLLLAVESALGVIK